MANGSKSKNLDSASFLGDLRNRMGELLGQATGVKAGMSTTALDEAVAAQTGEAPAVDLPNPIIDAMKDTEGWNKASKAITGLYFDETTEGQKEKVKTIYEFYKQNQAFK